MIVVKVTPSEVTVRGHAGYAEKGSDIICAAVSALTQNLIASIRALTEDQIKCEDRDGYIGIKFKNLSEQGKLLIDSFFIGISDISDAYGREYVQII